LLLADPGVDALVAMFIPLSISNTSEVATALAAAAHGADKPVLATFFGAPGVASVVAPIPCYEFPETAILALAAADAHRQRLEAPEPEPVPGESRRLDRAVVRPMIDRARGAGATWMDPQAATALLSTCGITVAPQRVVEDAGDAARVAREVGHPVVLKGLGPTLLHKTDSHAVHANLATEAAVVHAFSALAGRPDVTAVVVQAMIQDGVEMLVGAVRRDAFGHAIVCGSGGILVELLHDTSVRLAPVTPRGVAAMLNELRGVRLLRGFRGAPVLDEAALTATVLRVSDLLELCPEIAELDLNPVIVTRSGAIVVDARIRLD
jgi:acyl-CoA synthetase (NDP forming)